MREIQGRNVDISFTETSPAEIFFKRYRQKNTLKVKWIRLLATNGER